MIALMDHGNGGSKLLFWVLGLSIAILFAAVGLIVQDVRGDIEENHRQIIELHQTIIRLQAALHEEQRLTAQIREWYSPRIAALEAQVRQLQEATWPGERHKEVR